jgi:hypothetical protein
MLGGLDALRGSAIKNKIILCIEIAAISGADNSITGNDVINFSQLWQCLAG